MLNKYEIKLLLNGKRQQVIECVAARFNITLYGAEQVVDDHKEYSSLDVFIDCYLKTRDDLSNALNDGIRWLDELKQSDKYIIELKSELEKYKGELNENNN